MFQLIDYYTGEPWQNSKPFNTYKEASNFLTTESQRLDNEGVTFNRLAFINELNI